MKEETIRKVGIGMMSPKAYIYHNSTPKGRTTTGLVSSCLEWVSLSGSMNEFFCNSSFKKYGILKKRAYLSCRSNQ